MSVRGRSERRLNGILVLIVVLSSAILAEDARAGFRAEQQRYPRVRKARTSTAQSRDSLLINSKVTLNSFRLFIRVFKLERKLEIWLAPDDTSSYTLARTHKMTAFSGTLGPKRKEGDLQIPEGIYRIDRFNPASAYHLSLGLDYPNISDRVRNSGNDPGCDIFIHGNEVTIGCVPIGDSAIEELYILAVDAKNAGQRTIPVYIFPFRMGGARGRNLHGEYARDHPEISDFWDELQPAYDLFEKNRYLPLVSIDETGRYRVRSNSPE